MNGEIKKFLGELPGLAAAIDAPNGFARTEARLARVAEALKGCDADDRAECAERLRRKADDIGGAVRIYVYSFLMREIESAPDAAVLLDMAISRDVQEAAEILMRTGAVAFSRPSLRTPEFRAKTHRLYGHIFERLSAAVAGPAWIPPAERNNRLVVFVTQQFLSMAHAPTRDLVYYARYFMTRLGKVPLIVNANTAEMKLSVPFYKPFIGSVNESLNAAQTLQIDQLKIPFRQIGAQMFDFRKLSDMVHMIAGLKPAMVIGHGAGNYLADLCGRFTDAVIHNTTDELGPFQCQASFLCRPLPEADKEMLRGLGVDPARVIQSRPAFELPNTGPALKREDFGLSDDDRAICVVGNRLDTEITPSYLEMLRGVLADAPKAKLLLVGSEGKLDSVAQMLKEFGDRTLQAGFQGDLLAFYNVCDAFANPPRGGGGTSAAYALSRGVPVVALPAGDVATVAGPEFVFRDEEACRAELVRLVSDDAYLEARREAARARFAECEGLDGMWRAPLAAFEALTGAPLELPQAA
ncbi:MAG: hypothetical protein Tsb0010_03130 [Parvularculaceae bacterium]